MNVVDLAILVSMGALAVFFAWVTIVEWRDRLAARGDKQADAQVIQHPRSDRRVDPAA